MGYWLPTHSRMFTKCQEGIMVIFIMITNMHLFPHVMDHSGMTVVSTGNAETVEQDGIGASDVWL